MTFINNLQKSKEIIESLKTSCYFKDLQEGDTIWMLYVKSLEIKSFEIEEIMITEFMVDISLKESKKGFCVIGNTNLAHDSERIACTSRKAMELIKEILMALKYNVQMKGFKELFHYGSWDYDKTLWHN